LPSQRRMGSADTLNFPLNRSVLAVTVGTISASPANSRESLGMRVITGLAAQLGGELTAGSTEPGAQFRFVFPLRAS
jgi:two-component sensor histidine kinase